MQAGLGKELAELEGPELDGVQVVLGSASSEKNESTRTEMVLTCPSKGTPAVTNVNTLPDDPGSLVRVLSCMRVRKCHGDFSFAIQNAGAYIICPPT